MFILAVVRHHLLISDRICKKALITCGSFRSVWMAACAVNDVADSTSLDRAEASSTIFLACSELLSSDKVVSPYSGFNGR